MTDLERFAAALLMQWRADGGEAGGPMTVGAVLDRVLPYRVARRHLGIDVSEDYEALVIRLVSEEAGLSSTSPGDAAEMARETMASKLPDLDVLQLLRAATITLTDDAIRRLHDVLPMPVSKEEARGGAPAESAADEAAVSPSDDVIPLHPPRHSAAPPAAVTEPPPAFLTTVSFTPPAPERCWSCAESMPSGREVKFCPFCGADQREPACAACGAPVERSWKHCPDCGARIADA